MLQQRTLTLFLLALVFGGLAAFIAYQRSEKSAAAAAANSRLVVVAAFDIEYGVKIEANMIKQVPWPVAALPEGVISAPADAIGKVAKVTIGKGEPVTRRRAVESLGGSSLASLIEPGKRAMTVRVNDVIGVAGFLLPGNRVDVLGTPKSRGSDAEPETTTLVQNLKVLAVDQQARAKQDDPIIVRAVTVEVTPLEAEIIVQATNAGAVQLVLRNPLDEETALAVPPPAPPPPPVVAPEPVVPVKTRSKQAAAAVAPAPKAPATVTVIRGIDPENVPVRN